MIKIIRGIYGYQNKTGIIEPKSKKSAPFSLSAEREEQLVKSGVAEYVEEPEGNEPENTGKEEEKKTAKKPAAKKPAKKTQKKEEQDDQPDLEAVDPE